MTTGVPTVPEEGQVTTARFTNELLSLPELQHAWTEVELEAGEHLFHQGDPGDAFYAVIEGQLEVYAENASERVVLAVLGPGNHVGELALLDGGVRSAAVCAVTRSRLGQLLRADFLELLPRSPALAATTVGLLGRRMRRNVTYIGYLTRWAALVAEGKYAAARRAIEEGASSDQDPNVALFVATFLRLVEATQAREADLKRQLRELRIEIDRAAHAEKVAEITESDFFRRLEREAAAMRARVRGTLE